ncbi:Uncharacterised protein [Bordetella pertussis]|nr:Uncharacterised protein [Bordetella pertussis]CFW30613.1 Uncharacterised protein [Bordetella pertussis]CPM53268.1 Uncharacterised protein [Bordetella pertussis]
MPSLKACSPKRSMISTIRRSPVMSMAVCACRSPRFWSGERTLSSIRRISSSLSTPRRTILVGGKRIPSWCTSVRVRDRDAGTAPPMSVLWIWPPTKHTISPW